MANDGIKNLKPMNKTNHSHNLSKKKFKENIKVKENYYEIIY